MNAHPFRKNRIFPANRKCLIYLFKTYFSAIQFRDKTVVVGLVNNIFNSLQNAGIDILLCTVNKWSGIVPLYQTCPIMSPMRNKLRHHGVRMRNCLYSFYSCVVSAARSCKTGNPHITANLHYGILLCGQTRKYIAMIMRLFSGVAL